ncbi:MAG: hypoxanthine phosphoribosyltransferase [Chloroflexota bacterium]|nr:hypoxanthine phosphoribosyltransferase [Dehalococcoidia bacterium]MDW8252399.1 hypoxanthine phosphoribosyltransferase [Chloroflexota bacterium]
MSAGSHEPPNGYVLIGAPLIQQRVRELGKQIARDYADKCPIFIGVLRGVVVFLADLLRATDGLLCELDFMAISSYGSGSGIVRIEKDLETSIEGRHVILVEDIVDTGLTLRFILRNLEVRRPASLVVCTLLDKQAHRLVPLPIRYTGFSVGDRFVVGYGLDERQRYRNLPDLWVIDVP